MLTLAELHDALGATEPDYPGLAEKFGSEAIQFLRELVLSDDMRIATKAVHLASELGDAWCVKRAAKQPHESLRIAAAAAASYLEPAAAATILSQLKSDADPEVRSVASRYVAENPRIGQIILRRDAP